MKKLAWQRTEKSILETTAPIKNFRLLVWMWQTRLLEMGMFQKRLVILKKIKQKVALIFTLPRLSLNVLRKNIELGNIKNLIHMSLWKATSEKHLSLCKMQWKQRKRCVTFWSMAISYDFCTRLEILNLAAVIRLLKILALQLNQSRKC